jgi:hypothetical protein
LHGSLTRVEEIIDLHSRAELRKPFTRTGDGWMRPTERNPHQALVEMQTKRRPELHRPKYGQDAHIEISSKGVRMSGDEARVGAIDFRRALALIQHGERGDEAGMRVIIDDEVIPADRLEELIRATVSILWQLVAQLCEPDEVTEVGEMLTVASTADEVELDRENRLVAQLAMAQHSGNPSVEHEVLREAATAPDGLVQLALTAAGVVPALLPQLRTDAGRQLLNNLAMQALREEDSS